MTIMTIDTATDHDVALLDDTRDALRLLREEIAIYRDKLAAADADAGTAAPDVRRLNGLFATCTETENRIAKARNEKAGIAQNGIAFDLEEARTEIGRKLDRLRNA